MATFQTYSKSKKGVPEVFQYDIIPEKLKVQCYHIWTEFFKQFEGEFVQRVYSRIYDTLRKETGKKSLYFNGLYIEKSSAKQIEGYFNELKETDEILDVVHIVFFYIEQVKQVMERENTYTRLKYAVKEAIDDLNTRFKENAVGYEYSNGKIIRVDNLLLHSETVVPTLHLIQQPDYENVEEEYLKAHEHLRYKRYQECLNECLKAFETTMKIICTKNGMPYKETDTAKPLINALLTSDFLPNYNESYLSALRQLLESSIPTIRNKNGGHGQGTKKRIVPEHLARYLLYLTGATIRLLVETQATREK